MGFDVWATNVRGALKTMILYRVHIVNTALPPVCTMGNLGMVRIYHALRKSYSR